MRLIVVLCKNFMGVGACWLMLLVSGTSLAVTVEEALLNDPVPNAEYPASVVELSIPSDGSKMPGHLYMASGEGPHPTMVFLHGIPGNERNLDIAQALRRFGFNTLFFHYRGAWGAEGEYRITQLPEDALAVLDFLRAADNAERYRVDTDALSLLGHSLGGYTALAAGSRDSALRCVAALSPANVGLWKDSAASDGATIQGLSSYADTLYMLRGLSGERLIEELSYAPLSKLDTRLFGPGLVNKSVLLAVGDRDEVTPADTMLIPVAEAYREEEDIDLLTRILPGDHSFSGSRVQLTREILAWADTRCRAPGDNR